MSTKDVLLTSAVLMVGVLLGYMLGRHAVSNAPQAPAPVVQVLPGSPAPPPAAPAAAQPAAAPAAAAPVVAEAAPAPAPSPPPAIAAVPPAPSPAAPTPTPPSVPSGRAPTVEELPQSVRDRLPKTAFALTGAPLDGEPEKAYVAIVAFSDFECSFCSKAVPTMKRLREKFGEKLVIAFRHNPLDFHENARPAAKASYAAQQQGKFWPFHDRLFAEQSNLNSATYLRIATDLGLDIERFDRDMASAEAEGQIEADLILASSAEVDGTPTFLVNGARVVGALPYEEFERRVENEVGRVQHAMSTGKSLAQARGEISDINLVRNPTKRGGNGDIRSLRAVPIAGAPAKGAVDALVTIVEFSDFECPFCSRLGEPIERLLREYPNDLRVVFRQKPLPFHESAHLAAQASLAANEQGKFWEMHDRLFSNQQALGRADLTRYASEIGCDTNKFDQALDGGTYQPMVDRDLEIATALGVDGTPTLFINGRMLTGARPYEELKEVVDDALAQANRMIGKGTVPRANFYQALMGLIPEI